MPGTSSATTEKRRARIIAICLALPEATHRGGQHQKFEVRGRTFACHVDNEHGDGRVAVIVKTLPGAQTLMVQADPARYYVPKYIGHRGWVALRVDTPGTDWDEVTQLIRDSYRLVAPRRLAALTG
jgi:phosphoribosylglycinamide formyltransferase-1